MSSNEQHQHWNIDAEDFVMHGKGGPPTMPPGYWVPPPAIGPWSGCWGPCAKGAAGWAGWKGAARCTLGTAGAVAAAGCWAARRTVGSVVAGAVAATGWA